MMKCTVIIPVYNCQPDMLRRCLGCFSAADSDLEVLVVDDGSTNEVPKVLAEYPVRVITQSNSGVSTARNRGIDEASGEYIVFCDADDVVDLEALNKAISLAGDNGADYVLTSYRKVIGASNTVVDVVTNDSPDGYLKQLLSEPNRYGTVWAKIIRRDFIISHGIKFDQNLTHGEDSIFIMDCLKYSPKVAVCNEPFYTYYVNLSSAAKANSKAVDNYIKMMRVGKEHIKDRWSEMEPYYSCFCNVNVLILLVNYVFPKGSKYREGKDTLVKVLNTDIVRESLASYSKEYVSLTNRAAFTCLRNRWYIMCYMMARLKNRKK